MDAKNKAEMIKKKLQGITVTGQSPMSEVVVNASGDRKITHIEIQQSILNVREKSDIETLVKQAVNEALEAADQLMAEEMKQILPNIPGIS